MTVSWCCLTVHVCCHMMWQEVLCVCFVSGCAMLLAFGWLVNGAVMFFGEAGYCQYHTVCIYGVKVTCVVMMCCGGSCG